MFAIRENASMQEMLRRHSNTGYSRLTLWFEVLFCYTVFSRLWIALFFSILWPGGNLCVPYNVKLIKYTWKFHIFLIFTLTTTQGHSMLYYWKTEQKWPPKRKSYSTKFTSCKQWKMQPKTEQRGSGALSSSGLDRTVQKQHQGWRIQWILVLWSQIDSLLL